MQSLLAESLEIPNTEMLTEVTSDAHQNELRRSSAFVCRLFKKESILPFERCICLPISFLFSSSLFIYFYQESQLPVIPGNSEITQKKEDEGMAEDFMIIMKG